MMCFFFGAFGFVTMLFVSLFIWMALSDGDGK